MSNALQGLRVKQTYEDLSNVAVPDGLENIKFPNGDATFLREGFVMSQLGNEGMGQMENNKKSHLNKHLKKVYENILL